MKVLNFGSVNIDHVYRVDHFVVPGETLPSDSYQRLPGGKGFNQTVALARAGAAVSHAGRIGTDGIWLRDYLGTLNVDTTHLNVSEDVPTGHAIIQVGPTGENAILLHGGANHCIAEDDVDRILQDAARTGDALLLQNEISAMPHLISSAADTIASSVSASRRTCSSVASISGSPCSMAARSIFTIIRVIGERKSCASPSVIVRNSPSSVSICANIAFSALACRSNASPLPLIGARAR